MEFYSNTIGANAPALSAVKTVALKNDPPEPKQSPFKNWLQRFNKDKSKTFSQALAAEAVFKEKQDGTSKKELEEAHEAYATELQTAVSRLSADGPSNAATSKKLTFTKDTVLYGKIPDNTVIDITGNLSICPDPNDNSPGDVGNHVVIHATGNVDMYNVGNDCKIIAAGVKANQVGLGTELESTHGDVVVGDTQAGVKLLSERNIKFDCGGSQMEALAKNKLEFRSAGHESYLKAETIEGHLTNSTVELVTTNGDITLHHIGNRSKANAARDMKVHEVGDGAVLQAKGDVLLTGSVGKDVVVKCEGNSRYENKLSIAKPEKSTWLSRIISKKPAPAAIETLGNGIRYDRENKRYILPRTLNDDLNGAKLINELMHMQGAPFDLAVTISGEHVVYFPAMKDVRQKIDAYIEQSSKVRNITHVQKLASETTEQRHIA